MTQPLSVSERIRATAGVQSDAAATIETATSVTDGSAGDVFATHGTVCSTTAAALKSAESARWRAAESMRLTSTDLSLKLNTAATDYESTDRREAGDLGEQLPG